MIARIHQEPKVLLAQKPSVLIGPVVIARIHQEPKVLLAQKPNVLIGPAVTAQLVIDLTNENPKALLAQKPNVLIGRVVTAQVATENLMLKKKVHQLLLPVTTRKAVPPRPDQEAAGHIPPTGAHPAGALVKVLQGQARIDLRYPSNAPSPRRING